VLCRFFEKRAPTNNYVVSYVSFTGNVEHADLAEHRPGLQRREHRQPVIGYDVQSAAFDDVHLLAYVALAAHVLAGTEYGRAQLQHKLCQQPGLALLEDGDPTQRVGVHVERYVGAHAVWKIFESLFAAERRGVAVRPQVVEPADDAQLETPINLAYFHVFLDAVEQLLKLVAVCIRLADRLADAADDGGDDEDSDQVFGSHDDELQVISRVVHLADRRQHHQRPVEARCVVVGERTSGHRERNVAVDKLIRTEALPDAHLVVATSIPVDQHNDAERESDDPYDVRVARTEDKPVLKLGHPSESKQAVEAHVDSPGAEPDVQQIGGQQAGDVHLERHTTDVVGRQQFGVEHGDSLVEVGCQGDDVNVAIVTIDWRVNDSAALKIANNINENDVFGFGLIGQPKAQACRLTGTTRCHSDELNSTAIVS